MPMVFLFSSPSFQVSRLLVWKRANRLTILNCLVRYDLIEFSIKQLSFLGQSEAARSGVSWPDGWMDGRIDERDENKWMRPMRWPLFSSSRRLYASRELERLTQLLSPSPSCDGLIRPPSAAGLNSVCIRRRLLSSGGNSEAVENRRRQHT